MELEIKRNTLRHYVAASGYAASYAHWKQKSRVYVSTPHNNLKGMRNSGTGVELALNIFKVREWQIERYKFFGLKALNEL